MLINTRYIPPPPLLPLFDVSHSEIQKVTEVAYFDSDGLHDALPNPEVAAGDADGELPVEEVLRLVASAERGSEHPLAKV